SRGKNYSMKTIALKLICAAALITSLTGCIMYVSPDHKYHTDDTPAADEKPAEVLSSSQSF
ncbi:MAG TPA: hypothetical protein VLZ84_00660, partial [Asticcacaulis sp.]|nr:hypothetical protein [Asticcacaulis sp.]